MARSFLSAMLAKDDAAKLKIALGRVECLASTGGTDKAIEALGPFAEREKPSADALAKRADLMFGLGRWEDADASAQEVKTRFKALVKRHHPDANGGDRSSEERLREIIQAYNYLKSIGFR